MCRENNTENQICTPSNQQYHNDGDTAETPVVDSDDSITEEEKVDPRDAALAEAMDNVYALHSLLTRAESQVKHETKINRRLINMLAVVGALCVIICISYAAKFTTLSKDFDTTKHALQALATTVGVSAKDSADDASLRVACLEYALDHQRPHLGLKLAGTPEFCATDDAGGIPLDINQDYVIELDCSGLGCTDKEIKSVDISCPKVHYSGMHDEIKATVVVSCESDTTNDQNQPVIEERKFYTSLKIRSIYDLKLTTASLTHNRVENGKMHLHMSTSGYYPDLTPDLPPEDATPTNGPIRATNGEAPPEVPDDLPPIDDDDIGPLPSKN